MAWGSLFPWVDEGTEPVAVDAAALAAAERVRRSVMGRVFRPQQARSRFAAFDPANKDKAFLLGANAADPAWGSLAPAFDMAGKGYDYDAARAAGLQPDATGHWPSRDPVTGLILKGRGHPTFDKTLQGETDAGYVLIERDGRLYSVPKADAAR